MAVFVIDDILEGLATKKPVFLVDDVIENTDGVRKVFDGKGFLAGPAPTDHLKLPDGTPAAGCRVELFCLGVKVAEVMSEQDGSWRFDNLDHTLEYQIVASHHQLESIISTKRYPSILPVKTTIVASFVNPTTVQTKVLVEGGMGIGTYSVSNLTPSPNVSLSMGRRYLTVNSTRVSTQQIYQIQIESAGVVEPTVLQLVIPAL